MPASLLRICASLGAGSSTKSARRIISNMPRLVVIWLRVRVGWVESMSNPRLLISPSTGATFSAEVVSASFGAVMSPTLPAIAASTSCVRRNASSGGILLMMPIGPGSSLG